MMKTTNGALLRLPALGLLTLCSLAALVGCDSSGGADQQEEPGSLNGAPPPRQSARGGGLGWAAGGAAPREEPGSLNRAPPSRQSALVGAFGWDPGMTVARVRGIELPDSTSLDGSSRYENCSGVPCSSFSISDGWYNLSSGMDWSSSPAAGASQVHGWCAPS